MFNIYDIHEYLTLRRVYLLRYNNIIYITQLFFFLRIDTDKLTLRCSWNY